MPAMKYYPDPRTCPLAIALREKLENLFGKDALNDVAIYQAYSEVIFEKTKQTFRGETFWADHSRSVEKSALLVVVTKPTGSSSQLRSRKSSVAAPHAVLH
jgi:hypothetical protein